jgi:site-specific recombinase XerC
LPCERHYLHCIYVCATRKLRVRDVCHGEYVASCATIMQQKTQRPVQFEITKQTRDSVAAWIRHTGLHVTDLLFTSRIHDSPHLPTRQYSRLVHRWIASIGLDGTAYGMHTMRRTKVSLIYRHTKNLRAVQLLRGHSKRECTVRYGQLICRLSFNRNAENMSPNRSAKNWLNMTKYATTRAKRKNAGRPFNEDPLPVSPPVR